MPKIDHLGIAVKSISEARRLYESLGLRIVHEEEIVHEGVRTAMIPAGESRIELLQPLGDNTPVGKFLARYGEGLHHYAIHVEDIGQTFEGMKQAGVKLISDDLQVGVGGHLYFFVHPSAANGVLLEICQDPIADV
jgi:methylmalonyl-CoA/ethylmalonyl-CoA epimerase